MYGLYVFGCLAAMQIGVEKNKFYCNSAKVLAHRISLARSYINIIYPNFYKATTEGFINLFLLEVEAYMRERKMVS